MQFLDESSSGKGRVQASSANYTCQFLARVEVARDQGVPGSLKLWAHSGRAVHTVSATFLARQEFGLV